jgi:hypothetical protein
MGHKKPGVHGKGAARGVMPLPALPTDAAADVDVDDDDVAFIQSHRRQLQRLANAKLKEAPCVPPALPARVQRSCLTRAASALRRPQSWQTTQEAQRRGGRRGVV